MQKKLSVIIVFLLFVLALSGCSSLMGNTDGTGELALLIADAPVNDVQNVYVTIDEVRVHNVDTDSWEVINDFSGAEYDNGELQVDLLALRFDEELLGQAMIPAGTYDQIRLHVAAAEEGEGPNGAAQYSGKSYIVYKDNGEEGIFIPSGTASGLKINHEFTIEEGIITRLVLDNDVSELLNSAGRSGKIILRPTSIEVIDKVVSGNIRGRVFADINDDDIIEEVITDNTVVVGAYQNDILVKETYATVSETETADGEVIPAGSFFLRGLEEGQYTLKAKVVDDTDSELLNSNDEVLYTLQEEVTVEVVAEETVTQDLYLDKNVVTVPVPE